MAELPLEHMHTGCLLNTMAREGVPSDVTGGGGRFSEPSVTIPLKTNSSDFGRFWN